jgi:hypothetical protein
MRINIPTARRRGLLPEASSNDSHDAVVSLMVAVAKTLPDKDFKNLRDQLEDISS